MLDKHLIAKTRPLANAKNVVTLTNIELPYLTVDFSVSKTTLKRFLKIKQLKAYGLAICKPYLLHTQ